MALSFKLLSRFRKMEYSREDKIRLGQEVVRASRKDARVDTGLLKRSIRATLNKGVIEFREIYYGAFNENSKLIKNAQKMMPKGIEWRVIFVDENGLEKRVTTETRTGRKISTRQVTSKNQSTKRIKSLLQSLKTNGEKKDDTGKGNRSNDEKAS